MEFDKIISPDAKPLQPPYYAIRLSTKVDYTMGGVKINSKAQLIDINNQPTPNLYTTGEVSCRALKMHNSKEEGRGFEPKKAQKL